MYCQSHHCHPDNQPRWDVLCNIHTLQILTILVGEKGYILVALIPIPLITSALDIFRLSLQIHFPCFSPLFSKKLTCKDNRLCVLHLLTGFNPQKIQRTGGDEVEELISSPSSLPGPSGLVQPYSQSHSSCHQPSPCGPLRCLLFLLNLQTLRWKQLFVYQTFYIYRFGVCYLFYQLPRRSFYNKNCVCVFLYFSLYFVNFYFLYLKICYKVHTYL